MTAYVSLDFVCKVIRAQFCDRLYLSDIANETQLMRYEGKPEELCSELTDAYANIGGTFRCEVWKSRAPDPKRGGESRGARGRDDAKFVFLLGRRDNGLMRDPDVYAGARIGRDPDPDGDDEEEEEEEEEERARPLLTEKQMDRLLDLGEKALGRFFGPKVPPRRARPLNGAQRPPVTSNPAGNPDPSHSAEGVNGASEIARMQEIGRALMRFRQAHPGMFDQYAESILENYGDKAAAAAQQQQPPAPNGES